MSIYNKINSFILSYKLLLNYFIQLFFRFSKYESRLKKTEKEKINFEKVLEDKKTAILHVGLSTVKASSAEAAYHLVLAEIKTLDNYAIPGFTPSFRKTGVYSYEYSKPEVGRFSFLASKGIFHRTNDPIHSLFFKKEFSHDEIDIYDTFSENGFYSIFVKEGSCWINIGTEHLVSTVFHHIERVANVPYLEQVKHIGVMYKDGSVYKIEHVSYKYNRRVVWNRKKIEKTLSKAGAILQQGYWNGAYCQVIDGHLAAKVLLNKLKDDPYYLVT